MFKYTITYTNYNDEEVTEDLYFHLTDVDLMEMEFGKEGGLENYIRKIINTKDMPSLLNIFKTLILKSYGVKDEKGRFYKSEQISKDLEASAAYPELYMKLATEDGFAADFIMGIIPKNIRENLANELKNIKKD